MLKAGITAIVLTMLTGQLFAETKTSQQPHVHGRAELTLAFESNQLDIRFTSPAVNIVGFEHQADNQAQIEAVRKAKATLQQLDKLFVFAGTACQVKSKSVDVTAVERKNEPKHNHEDSEHNKHSEIVAHYQLQCDENSKLRKVKVKLFELFSGVQEIHALWVTGTEQGAVTLTSSANEIQMK